MRRGEEEEKCSIGWGGAEEEGWTGKEGGGVRERLRRASSSSPVGPPFLFPTLQAQLHRLTATPVVVPGVDP